MNYKDFSTRLADNDFRENFDSYEYYITHGMKAYEQGFRKAKKEIKNEKDRRND